MNIIDFYASGDNPKLDGPMADTNCLPGLGTTILLKPDESGQDGPRRSLVGRITPPPVDLTEEEEERLFIEIKEKAERNDIFGAVNDPQIGDLTEEHRFLIAKKYAEAQMYQGWDCFRPRSSNDIVKLKLSADHNLEIAEIFAGSNALCAYELAAYLDPDHIHPFRRFILTYVPGLIEREEIRAEFFRDFSYQGNCKRNHLTLTPRIFKRYSGLHPASFLLLGTPNFSDVSALSNPRAIFFTSEKFSAA